MKKPRNIIFLQVDQLMTNVLSCYGETGANRPATFTRTPGIDEIASRGRIFMNSYCAGPQCVPSRTSWFTSRTVAETGVLRNEFVMEPDFPNLGSWVRDQADYLTVYAGKWHVSKLKVEDGFEVLDPGTQFGEGKDAGVGRSVMAFLNNYDGEKPFFLSAGLLNPHDCCFFSPTYGKYGLSARAASGDLSTESPLLPDNFAGSESKRLRAWTEDDWRYYLYQYSRQTEMIDSIVKRIWNTLKASRFADDTLFIFSADHGEGAANKGRVSKGYLDDNTMRVPLIVEGPGVKPGVDRTNMVNGIDIGPTVCELAGCECMPGVTVAKSLWPLIQGKAVSGHEYTVCESGKSGFGVSIITEQYQCNFRDTGEYELYDRANDPFQMNNLASPEGGKVIKDQHLAHLKEYFGKIQVSRDGGTVTRKYRDRAADSLKKYQLLTKMYDAVMAGELTYD